MNYLIEDGVPMPAERGSGGSLSKVIRAMKPGQSILVPSNQKTYAYSLAKTNGMKITTRSEPNTNLTRVWVVA